ncbi:MAG TPA: transketolase [Dehalococcoidia bacterium]|jgi:transketolase|nr:transketolase [Dehalococcoidia bacterium]
MTLSKRSDYSYKGLGNLMTMMTGDEKHSFSATSTLDVVWTLYDSVMNVDSSRPDDPARDRFLLSKGHGPMAYYAVLVAKGFLSTEHLKNWGQFDSILGYHPDGELVPGVELGTGSLGHGLGIGVGMLMGLRLRKEDKPRVFCLMGDAELDEGSNHEAIAMAARFGLEQLTVIVIDNNSASHGWSGGIAKRFENEGWSSATIDGRDHEDIKTALTQNHPGVPHVVVAKMEEK